MVKGKSKKLPIRFLNEMEDVGISRNEILLFSVLGVAFWAVLTWLFVDRYQNIEDSTEKNDSIKDINITVLSFHLLTIIFVFDPLAIALVIAANYAFEQLKEKTKVNLYGEKVPVEEEEDGFWTEEEMQDFNEQFNADDLLSDEDDKTNQLEFNFNQPISPKEYPTKKLEAIYKQWEEGIDWNKMEELRDAWVYLSPDHKRFLEKKYQEYKNLQIKELQNQHDEVKRSNKDSRWKSRNLQEINEKLNSLKNKDNDEDLTITY